MRQDSLFFGRGGNRFSNAVSIFISVVFLALMGYLLVRYKFYTYIVREQLFSTPKFGLLMVIYLVLAAVSALFVYRSFRKESERPLAWGVAIFCTALIARLIVYLFVFYTPANDFANYYEMGVAFANGDWAYISNMADSYQISSFSGIGVINGIWMVLTGTSARTFQLTQCVVTSFSSVAVYGLARRVDERSAPVAGLLFAFYPSNILFSQINSNQHIAVLVTLLAFCALLRALETSAFSASALWAALGGALLLIGYFAHPSAAPTLVALGALWLVLVCSALKKGGEILRLLVIAAAFCVGFFALRTGANAAMRETGLQKESQMSVSYLGKIANGLNPDTGGALSFSDWDEIMALPEGERQAYCMTLIRQRLTNGNLPQLLDTKLRHMWLEKDDVFGWVAVGIAPTSALRGGEASLLSWMAAGNLLDFFYVAVVYLFSWIGVLLRKRGTAFDLIVWVLLGWIGAHLLIEIQTRYRYLAMPLLFILAGYALVRLLKPIHRRSNKRMTPASEEGKS
jgi:hypothetical protein